MATNNRYLQATDEPETSWFDDGPAIDVIEIPTTMSGGIDTSAIDPWRQGVELTLAKHFDAGISKISAGEPNHILRPNSFGGTKVRMTNELIAYTPPPWDPLRLGPLLWVQSDHGLESAPMWAPTTGVIVTGDYISGTGAITKNTGADGWYDAFIQTGRYALVGDGYIEFTAGPDIWTNVMVGFTEFGASTAIFTQCAHNIYLVAGGTWGVYEHSTFAWYVADAFAPGDVFRITYSGGVVTYSQNGTVHYTSATPALAVSHVNFDLYNGAANISSIYNIKLVGADLRECIGTWRDKTTHHNDLTQIIGARMPMLDTTSWPWPVLRGVGYQNMFHTPEITDSLAYTMWCVCQINATGGGVYNDWVRNGGDDFSMGWSMFVYVSDDVPTSGYKLAYHYVSGVPSYSVDYANLPTRNHMLCSIVSYPGVNSPAFFTQNGVSEYGSSVAPTDMGAPGTMLTNVMGTEVWSAKYGVNGIFLEAGILDHEISSEDRQLLIDYLKKRYL